MESTKRIAELESTEFYPSASLANSNQRADLAELADHELLAIFQRSRDSASFAVLVHRHHAMIFGIAKRMLGCPHTSEDVVQATFLVLAKDSRKIRKRHSLVSWLYGVAYRISARTARQQAGTTVSTLEEDKVMVSADPLERLNSRFEQDAVFEELHRLPESLRAPLVLRYLNGNSNQQVAKELDLSESAVEGRLKRGRKQLRLRLARKGVSFGFAIGVLGLVQREAAALDLPNLASNTISAVTANVSVVGESAVANSVETTLNSEVIRLAEEEILKMATTKLFSIAIAASVVIGVVASGWAIAGNVPAMMQGDGSKEIVMNQQAGDSSDQAPVTALMQSDQEGAIAESKVSDGDPFAKENDSSALVAESPAASIGGVGAASDSATRATNTGQPTGNTAALAQRLRDVGYYSINKMSEGEVKIQESLKKNISMEYSEVPLEEIAAYISTDYAIQVVSDRNALSNESITFSVKNVRLENALKLMLDDLGLTAIVHNEVLLITSMDAAADMPTVRVYPIQDTWRMPADSLQTTIINNILRDSWEVNGGIGVISQIDNALVVTATDDVHKEINELFAQLDRLNSDR